VIVIGLVHPHTGGGDRQEPTPFKVTEALGIIVS